MFHVFFPFLIKAFDIGDPLGDNLAITFCWKRDPGRGIDSKIPDKQQQMGVKGSYKQAKKKAYLEILDDEADFGNIW